MRPAGPVAPAAGGDGLESAYRTLIRGSAFLAASLQARATGGRGGGDVLPDARGAKVVGNGLRELDRFLCLLLDEAVQRVAPPTFDHLAYARRNNVARKARDFHGVAGLAHADEARLRAIGRVRACLHHCRGIVHNPALFGDVRIAAASCGGEDRRGRRLELTFDDLARICRFYAEFAAVLMAVCSADRRIP